MSSKCQIVKHECLETLSQLVSFLLTGTKLNSCNEIIIILNWKPAVNVDHIYTNADVITAFQ